VTEIEGPQRDVNSAPREFKAPSRVAEVRGLPRRAGTIWLRIDWGGPTGTPWGFVQRKSYKNRTKAAQREESSTRKGRPELHRLAWNH
jgi:hypothetical protein